MDGGLWVVDGPIFVSLNVFIIIWLYTLSIDVNICTHMNICTTQFCYEFNFSEVGHRTNEQKSTYVGRFLVFCPKFHFLEV